VRAVAQAHQRGRRLYLGTVNLDQQQFVVWNMGLLASSGHRDTLETFRKVMLASASIPVAFPPVLFEVEAGGAMYDELHVDGGVGARMFYTAGIFSFAEARAAAGRPGREDIFIIHNGRLLPEARATPRTLLGIASRVIDSTGKSAAVGDLFRIHAVASREGAGYYWVTIPQGIDLEASEVFDPVMMSNLLRAGRDLGSGTPPWRTSPPGFRALYELEQ